MLLLAACFVRFHVLLNGFSFFALYYFFSIKEMAMHEFALFSVTLGQLLFCFPVSSSSGTAFLLDGDLGGVHYTLVSRVCCVPWLVQSKPGILLTPVIGSEMASDPVGVS